VKNSRPCPAETIHGEHDVIVHCGRDAQHERRMPFVVYFCDEHAKAYDAPPSLRVTLRNASSHPVAIRGTWGGDVSPGYTIDVIDAEEPLRPGEAVLPVENLRPLTEEQTAAVREGVRASSSEPEGAS
jgi:hypothetical protein